MTLNFTSRDEITVWVKQEIAFWDRLNGNDQFSRPVIDNRRRVEALQAVASGPTEKIKSTLDQLRADYIPSSGSLGKLLGSVADRDPNTARLTLVEIENPNSLGWQNQQPPYAEARTLASVYRVMGNPGALLPEIEAAQKEVTEIRAQDAVVLARFEALITRCETEWNSKIEGYEAKVALQAPRDYWRSRASKHEEASTTARSWWHWSLVITIVVLFALVGLAFSSIGDWFFGEVGNDPLTQAAKIVERLVVIGTVLAVAVWWSRQMLRDLRSHEHLAEDAAERVTMIETYAALKGAGLEAGNLGPVLAALYRPATTGLIEDSGPVLPLEVFMKGAADLAGKK